MNLYIFYKFAGKAQISNFLDVSLLKKKIKKIIFSGDFCNLLSDIYLKIVKKNIETNIATFPGLRLIASIIMRT